MIKKILLGIGSYILAAVIVALIPISSIVNNQTASDAIIVVTSILLAGSIYKLLKPKLIK